ncbi:WD40-repeat-containing domain protein [Hyaloraphidium curvatum]|nr:WD40-repeat-containing domain protein [Hyaloraphidium curvatum]
MAFSTTATAPQPKDMEIVSPPTDTVSDLAWSPAGEFLAASSWDNQTRIWEVQPTTGQSIPKAAIQHEAPALACHWSKDGTKLASGGADKVLKVMDIGSGQTMDIPNAHDAPIKSIRFVDGAGGMATCLATGSWDKTVRYWDLRQPQPIATVALPERVYTIDAKEQLMVVGASERKVFVFNLNTPQQIYKTTESPLKWQTRVVSCFIQANGYAIGSIEGRVGIQYVDDKDQTANFSFKCHRDASNNVFAVNAISFHPTYGTFSTAGSDGTFNFWDKDSKQRLKQFNNVGGPIVASSFSRTGAIFAYAMGYDWSKGYENNTPQTNKNAIFLHAAKEEDVKQRAPKPKTGVR